MTSEKDRRKLYEERGRLVTKELLSPNGLDAEETGRLGAVTWILEQLEAAELWPALDGVVKAGVRPAKAQK